jgi:hypothetical protein
MKANPGEGPGCNRSGSHPRPRPGNLSLAGNWFRAWPFSVRPQSVFANGRRPGRSVLPCDTGRFGVGCHEEANCHEDTPSCPSSGKVALTGTPPNARRRVRLDLPVAQLGDRCESPAAAERPEAANAAVARYVEVGGSGGIPGGWQRRSRPAGTGNDDGGKPQRRLSVARLTPFPVSCLLRHLSGSATPMPAGTAAKRAKSGVSR